MIKLMLAINTREEELNDYSIDSTDFRIASTDPGNWDRRFLYSVLRFAHLGLAHKLKFMKVENFHFLLNSENLRGGDILTWID